MKNISRYEPLLKTVFVLLLSPLFMFTSCEIDYDANIRHRINGRILDLNGNPIQGAKVEVSGIAGYDTFVTYSTNTSGIFDGYIAGTQHDSNQSYMLRLVHPNSFSWQEKTYYFSMKDQPNQTLNMNDIKIFPSQNLLQVQLSFNLTNPNLVVNTYEWYGDLALAEGDFGVAYNYYSFFNLAPPNSQSVITYELLDFNTGQKTSFTRTIEVLEENLNVVINH